MFFGVAVGVAQSVRQQKLVAQVRQGGLLACGHSNLFDALGHPFPGRLVLLLRA